MKEKILSIASDLRDSRITSYEAKNLLLGLFGVSGSVPNLNREKELEESLSDLLEMASTWGREWFKRETWDKVEKEGKCLLALIANVRQTCSVRILTTKHTMKEELKQKMIGVIGTHSNALIESIAEKCAQVAIDYYKERDQALSMSGVVGRSEQLCDFEHHNADIRRGYTCTECGCRKMK